MGEGARTWFWWRGRDADHGRACVVSGVCLTSVAVDAALVTAVAHRKSATLWAARLAGAAARCMRAGSPHRMSCHVNNCGTRVAIQALRVHGTSSALPEQWYSEHNGRKTRAATIARGSVLWESLHFYRIFTEFHRFKCCGCRSTPESEKTAPPKSLVKSMPSGRNSKTSVDPGASSNNKTSKLAPPSITRDASMK